jgi:hypothetical protein
MVCYTHIKKVSAMAFAISFLKKNIQNSIKNRTAYTPYHHFYQHLNKPPLPPRREAGVHPVVRHPRASILYYAALRCAYNNRNFNLAFSLRISDFNALC